MNAFFGRLGRWLSHREVEQFRSALEQLPLDQRIVLALRETGGLSYAEIAEFLGEEPDVIAQELYRGREALRHATHA